MSNKKEARAQAGGLPDAYQSELKSKSLRAWDSRSDVCKAGIHILDSPPRIQLWALRGLHGSQDLRLSMCPYLHLYDVERTLVKNGDASILPQIYPVSITALGPRIGIYRSPQMILRHTEIGELVT